MKLLQTLYNHLLDLAFPKCCLVCNKENSFLCVRCEANLPRLENQFCIACSQPSPFGKTHPTCRTRNTVDGLIAALPYKNSSIHKIIEAFKYNFISDLAQPLARKITLEILNQELAGYFKDFTVIPVPLHMRRLNWRGFNQAELLSRSLATELNISLGLNLISRQKFTQPQVRLAATARQKNIAGAFLLSGDISGQKFIIVDDVVASGSTINELGKLLKKNGATEVWGVTAAHG